MFRTPRASLLIRSWIVAVVAAGLFVVIGRLLDGGGGAVQAVVTSTHAQDDANQRVRTTGVSRGVWEVPSTGLYDLALDSRGHATWALDDTPVLETGDGGGSIMRTVWLDSGFHRVEIRQPIDPSTSIPAVSVAAAPVGRTPQPLPLEPKAPRNPRTHAALHVVRDVIAWLAILAVVSAIAISIAALRDRWSAPRLPNFTTWTRRSIAWAALAVIVVHAALLRIDSITARYGPVTSPRWLAAVQTRTIAPPQSLRRASITWPHEDLYPHADGKPTHYVSDPYTYLESARAMSWFYAAQWREPVFPFVTRNFLHLLHDQDVAVSFASAFFSTLAVWLTYVLGATYWSRPAGLLAALGLSLDYDVISRASLGWRDDAYMAMVTLCAYVLLRWWRSGRMKDAVLFGVAGGFAILTRIMAASFLLAAVVCVVLARPAAWRRHLNAAATALGVAVLVAAPYFVNCWRVFGDPLYTFNVHGHIYSVAERHEHWEGSTAGYVALKIEQRPFEMLDTVAQGLTTYPFLNKWRGLDFWLPGLSWWAALASIVGLVVFAASAEGRLLLVLMVSSLVPFSFTWTVDPDFRFTMHAYPMLMIAAAVAVSVALRAIRWAFVRGGRSSEPVRRPIAWLPWLATIGLVLAVLWFTSRVSPSLVFAETLHKGEDATVTAGVRDGGSFGSGWSELLRGENVSLRVVMDAATVLVRLPAQGDYPVTMRMDPFPRPLVEAPARMPVVDVTLNGINVGEIQLRWTSGRVGSYEIALPRTAVRRGVNRLMLRVKRPAVSPLRPGLTDGDAVGLWYVRVHPAH